MRPQVIAEIGGSLLIAALTGLFLFAGLGLGAYCLFSPTLFSRTLGLLLIFFGVENLPIFVLWCRQAVGEYAEMISAGNPGR